MKVLVTGGAGFVGTNLTLSLLEYGYDVKIFDDLSTGLRQNIPKDVEFINASLLDTSNLNNAIKFAFNLIVLGIIIID